MSTYVMADIHGCYTEFMTMLKKIKFNPEKDELIIAGDIIDRGPESYEMLKYMESKPKSVTFLLGNHDMDFIQYCKGLERIYKEHKHKGRIKDIVKCDYYQFYVSDYYDTVKTLLYDSPVTKQDFENWKKCFEEMPYFVERTIKGRNYIIVHAGYITEEAFGRRQVDLRYNYGLKDEKMFNVWARYEHIHYGGKANTTIIFGHTPTIFENEGFYKKGKVWFYERGDGCRFYNIDCGYVYKKNHPIEVDIGNMACIRLEDEKIFYLEG